jgi:hypothetical protein
MVQVLYCSPHHYVISVKLDIPISRTYRIFIESTNIFSYKNHPNQKQKSSWYQQAGEGGRHKRKGLVSETYM